MAEQFPIDKLNENPLKNWNKVGVAFYETKDALEPIVRNKWSEKKTKRARKSAADSDIYYILKFIKSHKEVYTDEEFQKAAAKVLIDRNDYIHELSKAEVSDEQFAQWTGDMLSLLGIVETLGLSQTAEQTKERIEKIRSAEYTIVQEDLYKAKLSKLEAEIIDLACKVQAQDNAIQSIKAYFPSLEESQEDSPLGARIKDALRKVEDDLRTGIDNLDTEVAEVKENVDYLLDKDPGHKANQYVQQLTANDTWNSKSDFAISELLKAYQEENLTVADLLIRQGVRLSMEHLHKVVLESDIPLNIVQHLITHLKISHIWDKASVHASNALDTVYSLNRQDLLQLLNNEVKMSAEESAEEPLNDSDISRLKSLLKNN